MTQLLVVLLAVGLWLLSAPLYPVYAGNLTEPEFRVLVARHFPSPVVDYAVRLVTQCENRKLNPAAVSGTRDYGLFQINQIHRRRVEKLYGMPFEKAMHDPELNVRFAALKHAEEGWRPWICSRRVR